MKEGYTKFNSIPIEGYATIDITKINQWRNKLYELKLIGVLSDGKTGYGNISIRNLNPANPDGIIISGTATGSIEVLAKEDYSFVVDYSYEENWVKHLKELANASSETLSHEAVYKTLSDVNAVIHIHNKSLWGKLINNVPTTSPEAKYGTPEMAYEIERLCQNKETQEKKIIMMAGHEDGIITFGKNLDEAGTILLEYFNK